MEAIFTVLPPPAPPSRNPPIPAAPAAGHRPRPLDSHGPQLHEAHVFGVRIIGELGPKAAAAANRWSSLPATAEIDDRLLATNAFFLPHGLHATWRSATLENRSSAAEAGRLFVALILEVVHDPRGTRNTMPAPLRRARSRCAPPQITLLGVVVEIFVGQTAVVVPINNAATLAGLNSTWILASLAT